MTKIWGKTQEKLRKSKPRQREKDDPPPLKKSHTHWLCLLHLLHLNFPFDLFLWSSLLPTEITLYHC